MKRTHAKPDNGFLAYVLELMPKIGIVTTKRLFRGHGIFIDGIMIGIVSNGELFLKTDSPMRKEMDAMNLSALSVSKKGKLVTLSYQQAPYEVFDDAEAMRAWVERSHDAAIGAIFAK